MTHCEHANFDEYFGACTDCGATREQVIADEFRDELQPVYKKILDSLGIESGDISPEQALELETKEQALAEVVASWINSRYDTAE